MRVDRVMRYIGRLSNVAALVLLAGCAGPYEIAQVEGVVRIKGKPTSGLYVQFLPDPGQGTRGPAASAETDDDGHYTLRYNDNRRATVHGGAVVGWNRVIVSDARQPAAPQGEEPRPSRVPEGYGDIGKTPLKFEVKRGEQTIDIDLN